ncbi:MAG: hypothetical protein IPG56_06145 [Caulobacteraceae bacterium]|nr:hypothetical protein [Caulobacteraceae bacterium]
MIELTPDKRARAAKSVIREHRFDDRLASVEITVDLDGVDILGAGRRHKAALNLRNASLWQQHD